MSGEDDIALVALIISLIALLISFGQLLQSIFGTAEGFRRTNRDVMSLFAQTRDRVFHLTELRYETRFRTPHFTFHTGFDESLSLPTSKDDSASKASKKSRAKLAISIRGSKTKDLNDFIKDSAGISKLQRFLNLIDRSSASSNDQLVSDGARGYAASWLLLLEQLYEHDKQFNQHGEKIRYMYKRQDDKTSQTSQSSQSSTSSTSSTSSKSRKFGPDRKQVRFPAIECHMRSWDLLPPDVVRPLASMSLGDLLTLCARLRITVHDHGPRRFSADGFGHSFWTLQIQGLGIVIQYRYDRVDDLMENQYHAFRKFIPCEDADKLAFGIIPKNTSLGIERDWHLCHGSDHRSFLDAMKTHFKDLGVSGGHLDKIMVEDKAVNDVWRTFGDTLLLLAPFMPIDGLGIVKGMIPMPFHWFDSLLWIREGQIVLWQYLHHLSPASPTETIHLTDRPLRREDEKFPSVKHWISHVLNFIEKRYHAELVTVDGFRNLLYNNAHSKELHHYLQQLRTAYEDADAFLIETFKQAECLPTYQYLVAAHHEMALAVHFAVREELRANPANKTTPVWDQVGKEFGKEFRNGTDVPGIWRWKTEMMYRYIDHGTKDGRKVGKTVADIYREKTRNLTGPSGSRPAELTDDQIEDGWCVMMLRGCLWAMTHQLINLPKMPYPSRLWQDSTLVLIA